MQIIALEQPVPDVRDDAFTAELLREEAEQVWALHQSGAVRQVFFRADRHEAVLFLEMPDPRAARALLQELPLVRAGLITFDLIPLRAYPGFARLFASPGDFASPGGPSDGPGTDG